MAQRINTTDEDYLDEDPVISNQQWVCLSILTPNSIKDPEGNVIESRHKVRAFKIRGVFQTQEKANKRCEEIRRFDKYHHVFVGEVGKWLPWDDDASNAEEAVYAEPKLNEMMKAYKESQQNAAEYNEERKMKAHADASKAKRDHEKKYKVESNLDVTKNVIESSINESVEQNEELNKSVIEQDVKKLSELDKVVTARQQELDETQNVIQNKEKTITKIDEELEKARELYEQLMEKYQMEKK